MSIEALLVKYNVERGYVDPMVRPYLNTATTLIEGKKYVFGNFLTRLFNRIHLVDDFRCPGIAYATFRPDIRRISIVINPMMMWDIVLRTVAISAKVATPQLLEIDRVVLDSFQKGGWTEENFKIWINFLETYSGQEHRTNRNSFSSRNPEPIKSTICSVFIHEMLHCIWSHIFVQRIPENKNEGGLDMNKLINIAEDFAINQTLHFGCLDETFMTVNNKSLLWMFYKGGAKMDREGVSITKSNIDISHFDDSTFLNQPFEYYLELLKNVPESEMGAFMNGTTLKNARDGENVDVYKVFGHEGVQQFEEFNNADADAKKVVENDLKRVIDEMMAKDEIQSPEDVCRQHPFRLNGYFAKVIEGLYKTETISWEHILRHYLNKALGASQHSYTMKRECRSVPDFFPGKERLEDIDLNIVMDVSGSINFEDYNRFINEVEKIGQNVDQPYIRYVQFHSTIALDVKTPLNKIKKLGIASTGGTHMKSALDLFKKERNDKLTIVFTDGWVEEGYDADEYSYPIIIFVSSNGRSYGVEALRKRGFKVIHQDGDNEWFQ